MNIRQLHERLSLLVKDYGDAYIYTHDHDDDEPWQLDWDNITFTDAGCYREWCHLASVEYTTPLEPGAVGTTTDFKTVMDRLRKIEGELISVRWTANKAFHYLEERFRDFN